MNELDLELIKAKQRIKDIKKIKKQKKKLERIERQTFRPPVHMFVSDIVDTVCFTFKDLVKR